MELFNAKKTKGLINPRITSLRSENSENDMTSRSRFAASVPCASIFNPIQWKIASICRPVKHLIVQTRKENATKAFLQFPIRQKVPIKGVCVNNGSTI